MAERKLTVFRHPEVIDLSVCYGQIDPPTRMDADGLAQVSTLCGQASNAASFWTSPAARCLELANAVESRLNRPLHLRVEPRIWELSMGEWEGVPWAELEKRAGFQQWMQNWQEQAPPGGESLPQLESRVSSFVADLEPGEHYIFAHAGVIRALFVQLDGLSWQAALEQKIPFLSAHHWKI